MNDTGIMQEIRTLEQKIQESTERVAELSNKITEHRVGLSFDAVGQTDAIYEYEIDRENMIQQQMMLKQKLASLYNQVQIR
jgi:predicted RNase H-like nuclease (RuvC/YqgF family)